MDPVYTNDGSLTLYSQEYGVNFHSKFGAVTESMHVYINAGLRYKAAVSSEISILETGFGTGLVALMTLLESEKRNLKVQYKGLELYPLPLPVIHSLNLMDSLQAPERNKDLLHLHQCDWNTHHNFSDNFNFYKAQVAIEDFVERDAFDLIYFDAFAPIAQPALWTEAVMRRMYDSLRPDGVLVTYCAQGNFKRNLKKAGFTVEKLEGPPGKREMTRALK
jgi:tRNA U34 5-methylaminomethyl-2-thiouridine-forming methyltransferase MnmC